MDDLSQTHTVPLQKWIDEGVVFKFWGDNVDKQLKVRDLRSDHKGEMVHMFSLLAGRSRTPHLGIDHCQTGNRCEDREHCQNGNEHANQ